MDKARYDEIVLEYADETAERAKEYLDDGFGVDVAVADASFEVACDVLEREFGPDEATEVFRHTDQEDISDEALDEAKHLFRGSEKVVTTQVMVIAKRLIDQDIRDTACELLGYDDFNQWPALEKRRDMAHYVRDMDRSPLAVNYGDVTAMWTGQVETANGATEGSIGDGHPRYVVYSFEDGTPKKVSAGTVDNGDGPLDVRSAEVLNRKLTEIAKRRKKHERRM